MIYVSSVKCRRKFDICRKTSYEIDIVQPINYFFFFVWQTKIENNRQRMTYEIMNKLELFPISLFESFTQFFIIGFFIELSSKIVKMCDFHFFCRSKHEIYFFGELSYQLGPINRKNISIKKQMKQKFDNFFEEISKRWLKIMNKSKN